MSKMEIELGTRQFKFESLQRTSKTHTTTLNKSVAKVTYTHPELNKNIHLTQLTSHPGYGCGGDKIK